MSPTKAQRKYWAAQFPLYSWWVIAGVVGLLVLQRAFIYAARVHRRRSLLAQRTAAISPMIKEESASTPTTSAISRTWTALDAMASKSFSWRDYGVGLWKQSSNELFWSISYTLALLVFGFIYIDLQGKTTKDQWIVVANRMGDLVYIQLPFVIGLAAKNNVISFVTGVSHEKLNFLHRSSSRACILLSWFHALGRSVAIPLGKGHEIWQPIMIAGVISLLSMTLMMFLGWKPLLRTMAYEVFLYSHIVFAILSLAGLIVHDTKHSIFVWPSFVIWGFDRIARFLRVMILNKLWLSCASSTNESAIATIESLGSTAVRITLRRPILSSWTPGQHAFLVCPSVSTIPFEAHPFTISSIPSENKEESSLVFIAGVRDGFTRKLALKAADAGGSVSVPCYLDGPYGNVKSADSYSSVSLIAGGSGVTYTLPLLLNLVRQAKEGKAPVRHIAFIWTVRSVEHIAWISKTLDAVRASCPASVVLDIKIFVTRSSLALESGLETPASVSNGNGSDSDANSIEVNRLGANTNQSSFEDFDEKVVEGGNEKAGRKASEFEHALGRPDVACLLREAIAEAKGGATSITVCGPTSLARAVRTSLASWKGEAFSVGDVSSGRVGKVDLHVESFDW